METTIVYWGYIGDYIGIMESMEQTNWSAVVLLYEKNHPKQTSVPLERRPAQKLYSQRLFAQLHDSMQAATSQL